MDHLGHLTHYNHKNICRAITEWRDSDGLVPTMRTRDFPSIQKMNDTIINNINGVVMQDDILIHLGDWSFSGFNSIREFWDRLVCKNIILILGNHDHHIKKNKEEIRNLFMLVDKDIDDYKYDKHQFHLSHYPLLSWRDMRRGTIHLHGHTHLAGNDRFGAGKRIDVGVDGHPQFRPYNLKREIIPLMDKRPIAYDLGEIDHHGDKTHNKIK